MSQFLYYLLLNTTYFAREDILLWQSKYIFSGEVSISSLKPQAWPFTYTARSALVQRS